MFVFNNSFAEAKRQSPPARIAKRVMRLSVVGWIFNCMIPGEYNSPHPQNTKANVVIYSAGDFESPAESQKYKSRFPEKGAAF